jgi:hypothetical protein
MSPRCAAVIVIETCRKPSARTRKACAPLVTFSSARRPRASVVPRRISSIQTTAPGSLAIATMRVELPPVGDALLWAATVIASVAPRANAKNVLTFISKRFTVTVAAHARVPLACLTKPLLRIIRPTLFSDGSAMLMRGKSPTCRKAFRGFWSMTARSRVGDRRRKKARHRQVKDLPRISVAEPPTFARLLRGSALWV